jgi:hypothetical protein
MSDRRSRPERAGDRDTVNKKLTLSTGAKPISKNQLARIECQLPPTAISPTQTAMFALRRKASSRLEPQ